MDETLGRLIWAVDDRLSHRALVNHGIGRSAPSDRSRLYRGTRRFENPNFAVISASPSSSNSCRNSVKRRKLKQPQSYLVRRHPLSVRRRGSVSNRHAQLARQWNVEALGDDDCIVIPLLNNHRAFFRFELRSGDRAGIACACCHLLGGHSPIASGDSPRIEFCKSLCGLRTLPA